VPAPPISKSDDHFRQLGVEILSSPDGIRVAELIELFEKVRLGAVRRAAPCLALVWAAGQRGFGQQRGALSHQW